MTRDPEHELDRYIDALNSERRPAAPESEEAAALFRTVRSVKALREPPEPPAGLERRLMRVLGQRCRPSRWWMSAAAVAAALILVLVVPMLTPQDVATAVAQAVEQVERYHGILEKRVTTGSGREQLVSRQEVWVEGGRYAVRLPDGTITVNDGDRKWQVRPEDRVVALLPVAPDPHRPGIDLRAIGADTRQYQSRAVGAEEVAGRMTTILEITPPGGDPYRVWVDTASNLPIRLESPVQNALQTTWTFVELEVNQEFDTGIFALAVPDGYELVEADPGQRVSSPDEAAALLGFTPALPAAPADRLIAYGDRLVAEYGETTVVESRAAGEFRPATYGALGSAAGGPVEILSDQIRWRQDGLEITVTGPEAAAVAQGIAPDMALPDPAADFPRQPQVAVTADPEVAANSQKQVDAGHSPWQIDAAMSAQSFLGAQGLLAPASADALSVTFSTGVRAVVEVPEGPVSRIYLQRLVRQDETGVWSVVGYDLR